MSIKLSCGHEDRIRPYGYPVRFKEVTAEGFNAVSRKQYCLTCYLKSLTTDVEVIIEDWEEQEWLTNGKV